MLTDEVNKVNEDLEMFLLSNFTYDSSNLINNPEDVENDCMDGGCGMDMDMDSSPLDNGMNAEEGNQEDNQQQANSPDDVRLSYWYNHRL